jgi:membrane dipeptidase
MVEVSPRAAALHKDALVIDGLIFTCDGTTEPFRAGGVDAINLTVSGFHADFAETCDQIGVWIDRANRPDSPWRIIHKAADIPRARTDGKIGLIMGWQNMRPIEDKLERLTLFHRLGVRVMQLTYNERNFLGDGCLEPNDGGLSPLGKRAIETMNGIGIALDLSHVGERTCIEAAASSAKPVLVTHANAKAVANAPRNKSDAVIKAVAATGGLIGVSVYGPMCWDQKSNARPSLVDFLRHVDHVVDLVGPERISFGTDFPVVSDLAKVTATIEMTFNRYPGAISRYAEAFGNDIRTRYIAECGSPADLPVLTAALLDRGWSEKQVRGFLGENLLRVLGQIWGG